MNILQLNTGLFPDAQTVTAALRLMAATHRVAVVDVTRRDMRESDWDEVMASILAADRVITT
ncbi:MAG: hypothetical protein HXY29_02835 [Rhodocyclaceae bacterium]|jgi:hypothetical protein|nr:hypothetical protein [Thiobacillus sp.]NWG30417.1 hypothetical protein [Rhodocyclaceae bacterium]